MLNLFSIQLLEKEIEKLSCKEKDKTISYDEKIILSTFRKELLVLKKLKIEKIDLIGSLDEVSRRLDDQSIYFMTESEYNRMSSKADKFDIISDIIKPKSNKD